MTDTAVEELAGNAGESDYHTVLELWRGVLEPARNLRSERITPQWASRVVASFPGITFSDMPAYRDAYFDKTIQLLKILEGEIAEDDECLKHTSSEEDVSQNREIYANVILAWQKAILLWELEWEPTAPGAAVDLAATAEVHKMFFAEQGLTALLDQAGFRFEALQDTLVEEMEFVRTEWKAAHE